MKIEYQDIISKELGVEPMMIPSSLVSGQKRDRLYWFNWSCELPEDKKIFLKDIVEDGVVEFKNRQNNNIEKIEVDQIINFVNSKLKI